MANSSPTVGFRWHWHLLLLVLILFLPGWTELSDSPHVRLNAKHFNKLFNRFSAFVQPQSVKGNYYLPTPTIDSFRHGPFTPTSKLIESRRSNEFDDLLAHPINSSLHLHHDGINVFMSPNETMSKPILTTPSYPIRPIYEQFSTISPVAPLSTTMRPHTETIDTTTVVTAPTDQCKCVCRNNFKLETYDIRMEELKLKLLQAEVLSENKTPQNKVKIEDVLDSLVDEDESDYDDTDELEQIQKPTKYIPMEIIELSHRRPPRQPTTPTTGSPTSTTRAPPQSVHALHSTTELPNTAPLYSVSFTKPVNTIKYLATRVAQVGIPLLMTVALGNALTQIELVDRSATDDTKSPDANANLTGNPFDYYWNLFQMPLAANLGYYGPFYPESIAPIVTMPHQTVPVKEDKAAIKQALKPKKSSRNGWWRSTDSMLKRWRERFRRGHSTRAV